MPTSTAQRTVGYSILFLAQIAVASAHAQTEIGYGQNLLADLCSTTDTFAFEASVNDVVVAHVVELSDYGGQCTPGCCCFDQLIVLRDPQGQVLADGSTPMSFNSCGSRFRTQIGPSIAASTGAYTLTIQDGAGGGEYRLFLQSVNAPESAESLASGDTRIDVLNQGEVNTFQFEADSGDHVRIEMSAVDGSSIEPRLELYDPLGFPIALPTSGGIDVVVDEAGLLTLLAFSTLGQTGAYQLSLEIEPCQNDADCVHSQCTTATCNTQTGLCEQTVNPGHCLVNEQCFSDGEANPANECEVCDSAVDPNGWVAAAAGTPCGDQTADGCTEPDTCAAAACLPNNIVCDDNNLCNGFESCDPVAGCLPGNPLGCDDGIPCTVDECSPIAGCFNTPDTPCCELVCDDDNPCTIDSCSDGVCVFEPFICTDGSACTIDSCSEGACLFAPISCDDEQVCTDDQCDPTIGCVHTNNTQACDDGDPCTKDDVCAGGACVGVPQPGCPQCVVDADCDDGNVCTNDSCEVGGACLHISNSLDCDDGDPCTRNDVCSDGACVGVTQPDCTPCFADSDCDDGNECTNDSCDEMCLHMNNAAICDDGDPRTVNDSCMNGVCSGANDDTVCGVGVCGADSTLMMTLMCLALGMLNMRRNARR